MNLEDAPRSLINSVIDFPNEFRKKIIKLALLATSTATDDCSDIIDFFSNESSISKEQLYDVLGLYICIIKTFLTNNDSEFENKLLEIGFTTDFIHTLPFIDHREELANNLRNNYNKDFQKISSLKWRIDISLANSTLSKKIPSPVIFTFTLNNGKKYTIEIDVKMFHKLRFNVALLLKELTLSKTSSLMK